MSQHELFWLAKFERNISCKINTYGVIYSSILIKVCIISLYSFSIRKGLTIAGNQCCVKLTGKQLFSYFFSSKNFTIYWHESYLKVKLSVIQLSIN